MCIRDRYWIPSNEDIVFIPCKFKNWAFDISSTDNTLSPSLSNSAMICSLNTLSGKCASSIAMLPAFTSVFLLVVLPDVNFLHGF